MPNVIIGFAGKKQSGKTTAANIIKSIYLIDFYIYWKSRLYFCNIIEI